MCDRIRIRVVDRDKGFGAINQDDVVGTTYIPVSQISAPGEGGFLPVFGPCFLNLYGGPRTFDLTDEFDSLNLGEVSDRKRCMWKWQIVTSVGVLGQFLFSPSVLVILKYWDVVRCCCFD